MSKLSDLRTKLQALSDIKESTMKSTKRLCESRLDSLRDNLALLKSDVELFEHTIDELEK